MEETQNSLESITINETKNASISQMMFNIFMPVRMDDSNILNLLNGIIFTRMNHIQKAWLKILSPITPFVNEKMAKKGGILGKVGRFFAIGPRQFGYHPSNKYLALINRVYLQNIALSLHRYSFIK